MIIVEDGGKMNTRICSEDRWRMGEVVERISRGFELLIEVIKGGGFEGEGGLK